MYKVYLDDELMYHPNLVKQKNLSIEKTRLNVELNKTGSFTFVIRENNPRYAQLKKMQSIVKVYDDNDRLFRGRILNSTRGLYNELQVTCEGELAFLLDSRVRPYEFTGSVSEYHRFLVEQHNAQVDPVKQFKVGICTVTDPNDYISRASSDYPNTWDEFNEKLIKLLGGYIWTREEVDGVYIDYLADFYEVNPQAIEFGENLLDFEETIKGQDIATAIIPLGCLLTTVDKDGNEVETEERLTIADINDGVDYVYHEEAVQKYGLIFKVLEWDDVTQADHLKQKAQAELLNTIHLIRMLDLTAVDLHVLNVDAKRFRIGRYTPVRSAPHNIDECLLTRKLSINLLNAADSALVLGDEKQTFTDKHVSEKKETNLYIGQIVEANKTAIKNAIEVINSRTYSLINQNSSSILLKVANEYYKINKVDEIVGEIYSAINLSEESILSSVSNGYATKKELSVVEQTASSFSVTLEKAQKDILTAQNTANEAEAAASDAAKTATNFMRYSSSGLCIGDVTTSTLGRNINIATDSIEIRKGLVTLASFDESEIHLGNSSVESKIYLCGDTGLISVTESEEGKFDKLSIESNNLYLDGSRIGIHTSSMFSNPEMSILDSALASINTYVTDGLSSNPDYQSATSEMHVSLWRTGYSATISVDSTDGSMSEESSAKVLLQVSDGISYNNIIHLIDKSIYTKPFYYEDEGGVEREIMRIGGTASAPLLIVGDDFYKNNIGATNINGGTSVQLIIPDERIVLQSTANDTFSAFFRPNTNGKCALGTSGYRWNVVYAANATIQVSDAREKTNVIPLGTSPFMMLSLDEESDPYDIHSELFDRLRPVQYNLIEGNQRTCYGLIAQDVLSAMEELGIGEDELDLIHHETWREEETGEEKDSFGIAYGNLIAMLIHEVQKLKMRL